MPYQATMLCPVTGETIELSLVFDTMQQFQSASFEGNMVDCGACGEPHALEALSMSLRAVPS